jgi:TRAP-type C4-dicarboxylate transport system substrate-binding protein
MKGNGKSKWAMVFFLGVIISSFALGSTVIAAEKTYKVRMAYHWPPKHPCANVMQTFADQVTKATGGRIQFSIFPSGQLFPQGEEASSVGQGLVEFGAAMGAEMEEVEKGFVLESLMWIWDSYQQMRSIWTTDIGQRHLANAEKKWNIKVVGRNPLGPFAVWTKDRELMTKEDFSGLKIRGFSGAQPLQYKALGASAISLRTPEVYTALQSGMIDALPTTPPGMKAYSWWDFLKVANMPYAIWMDAYIVANADFWNRLPADLQQTIMKVGAGVTEAATDKVLSICEQIAYGPFVKSQGGKVATMPPAEMIRVKRALIPSWKEIGKDIDTTLWQEVLKVTGLQ